jgi:membrane protease subunit HflK
LTDHPHDSEAPDQQPTTARSASVQLRQAGEQTDHAALMDPANQSLAEALRITFRLLQMAMLVLVVLYIGSGFQSVKANERGVRLMFGEIVAQDLKPGFHFAPPYPIGELVKVDVGNKDLKINRSFWPYVEQGREDQAISELRAKSSLSPDQDGFLMTGDGALAHTQWNVQYSRNDAGAFARNIYPGHESGIIRAAVQRGIVHAVAGVEIDDLLKQSSSDAGSVAILAKSLAQSMLAGTDAVRSGVEIQQLSLDQKIPPVYLLESFNSVLSATSHASTAREEAQKQGNTMLSNTAGGAATVLVTLIDQYERQIDAGQDANAEATLVKIDRVFDGLPVEIDSAEINPSLGGQVAAMLSEARQYRSGVVDRSRSDLAVFQAKLEQFRANPSVMVTTDWTNAVSRFYGDERVEIFFNPAGTNTLELVINADPFIAAARERAALAKQNQEALDARQIEMEKSRYETEEGLRLVPN